MAPKDKAEPGAEMPQEKQIDIISFATSAKLDAALRAGICQYASLQHQGQRAGEIRKSAAEWRHWLKAELGVDV